MAPVQGAVGGGVRNIGDLTDLGSTDWGRGVWVRGFGLGLGFGIWGLGFGVWGLGFGVWGLGFKGLGFGVWEFWVWG